MNNVFEDMKKSILNESVSTDIGDDGEGQFAILKEAEYNDLKYIIVHDEIKDDFGYAIEGSPEFDSNNYPEFDWMHSSEKEAEEDAFKTIDELIEIRKGKIKANTNESDDRTSDGVKDFIKSTCGEDCLVTREDKSGESFYRITSSIKSGCSNIDVAEFQRKLEDKFPDKKINVMRICEYNNPTVYVTVSEKEVNEAATPEDKKTAEVLNGLADAQKDKNKAEALRAAAKTMEESLNTSIEDKVANFVSDKFSKAEIGNKDGENFDLILDKEFTFSPENLKEIAEFIKNETKQDKLPEIYADDPAKAKTLFIDGIKQEKKIEESTYSEIHSKIVDEFFYAFVVPEYVVRQFGEKPFIDKGFVKTVEGKMVFMHKIASDEDMKQFFGRAYQFVHDDTFGIIKTIVEDLNNAADADNKLDVEIDTVMDDVTTCWMC